MTKYGVPFELQNLSLNKTRLKFIFIPALVLLLFISIFMYRQVSDLISANQWVTHTHEVIETTDSVLYQVIDIESRQRAYLLTGEDQFLSETDTLKAGLADNIDKLTVLTKDNSQQHIRVEKFSKSISQRLDFLNQVARLKVENKLTGNDWVGIFHKSQEVSSQVKAIGQEIKSVEFVLLSERNAAALSRATTANIILWLGNSTGLVILIVAFLLVNSELNNRQNAEAKSKKIKAHLSSIIEGATDMIAALDKNLNFIIFNDAYRREFKRLFGKSLSIGANLEELLEDRPDAKEKLLNSWRDSLNGSEFTKNVEFADFNNPEDISTFEITSSLIQNDNNEISGAVHIIRNISKRILEHEELQNSYIQLTAGMAELQDKNEQITLLVEMSDIMLACSSLDELSNVMSKYSHRMLAFASGFLYVMHPSKNYLEMAASWNSPHPQETTFTPDQCWAIRLGRIHNVNIDRDGLVCNHIKTNELTKRLSVCIPLMAQNDIYGLLYLEIDEAAETFFEKQRLFVNAFSELTALALANIRLRENLSHLSIRDPLTGLYNRRYLEEFLFKQAHQAERNKTHFCVLMLDLDHFKKINDTYGHDAGDTALKELGKILQNQIRNGDIAARFGGEEFIILFYDMDAEAAFEKAEKIRHAVNMLQIKYGAQHVGPLGISIGIAEYPGDSEAPDALVEAADKALYHAKNNGRNQVILFKNLNNIELTHKK